MGKIKKLVVCFLGLIIVLLLCGCLKEFKVICIDESINYMEEIIVKKGEKFKCKVPEKEHYEFLYFEDLNGNIYTDENGYSLNVFDLKEDLTLIPRWKGDEILVSFEYNGGLKTGEDYIFMDYGSQFPSLPLPEKDHSEFTGWYTLDKNGNEIRIHDGIRLIDPKITLDVEHFMIQENKIVLTAKYDKELIDVTCIYYENNIERTKVIQIPYGEMVQDSDKMPTIINEYNQNQGFVWSTNPDAKFTDEEYLGRITQPITLYAIAIELVYKTYKARQSADLSKLLVDFRTSNQSDIDDVYYIKSGTKEVTFIGNPNVVYKNFSVVVSATNSDIEVTFVDFNYVGKENTTAFDARGLSNNCLLILNAKGNSSIKAANGSNGGDGVSYNRDKNSKHSDALSGGEGKSGNSGGNALVANSISIRIDVNGSLSLFGGNGGNGGNGGDGEGSQNDGIAQAGHGGNGDNGGNGGHALLIYGAFSIDSQGTFIAKGGIGGNGGHGGSGGNNLDKDLFDRADHGGNGGHGGSGGQGGSGIYFETSAFVVSSNWSTAYSEGGNGGNGGHGGDGGNGGKNEFQSGKGSNPGNAGNGGSGGSGGYSLRNCTFNINQTGGKGGLGASAGKPGTAPKGKGNDGVSGINGKSNN